MNLFDRTKIELLQKNKKVKNLCKFGIHRLTLFAYTKYPNVIYICSDCRYSKQVKDKIAYDKMLEKRKKYEEEKKIIPMTFRHYH